MASPLAGLTMAARNVLRVARLRPFQGDDPESRSLERYRRIVLSSAAAVAARATVALVGLAAVPVVLGHLGKERYGLWAAVGGLVPWVAMADLGLSTGLVNAVAEARGRDDAVAARRAFSTALAALTAVAAVLGALLLLVGPSLPWASMIPAGLAVEPGGPWPAIRAGLAVALAALPLGLSAQVLAGWQRAWVGAAFQALGAVLSLGVVLAAAGLGGGVASLVAATHGAALLAGLGTLAALGLAGPAELRPGLRWVSGPALRRLLATAGPIACFQLGALLVNQTQLVILSRRAGLGTVADYDVLLRFFTASSALIAIGTGAFIPPFREAHERGDHGWLRRSFWHLVRLRLALACGAGLLLLAGGNAFLRAWLHRADIQFTTAEWAVLAGVILASAWSASFLELLLVLDRIWPVVRIVLLQGVATAAATWALGGTLGVLGALLCLTVPSALLSGLGLPWAARPVLAPAPGVRPSA